MRRSLPDIARRRTVGALGVGWTLLAAPMLGGCAPFIGAGLERASFVHEGSLSDLRADPTHGDHGDAIATVVARWRPMANAMAPTAANGFPEVERHAAPVVPVVVASHLPDEGARDCYYADRSRVGCLRIRLMVRDGLTGRDDAPESLPPPEVKYSAADQAWQVLWTVGLATGVVPTLSVARGQPLMPREAAETTRDEIATAIHRDVERWRELGRSLQYGEQDRRAIRSTQWLRATAIVGDTSVSFDDRYRCTFDLAWSVERRDPPRLAETPTTSRVRCAAFVRK